MKKFLVLSLFLLTALTPVSAKSGDALTSLEVAIKQAGTEQKALFIMFGREACDNCQSLKTMVDGRQLQLSASSFLIADLNCDDPVQFKAFRQRYAVKGGILPLVVIAKPDGTMVASRSGGGSEKDYNDFIRDAKKELKQAE